MSELNKTLGRDFIIAFLLPGLIFLIASLFCLQTAGIKFAWLKDSFKDPLTDSSILALEAFVLAVILQSVNRELFRLAEGYWWSPIPQWVSCSQRRRFRELHEGLRALKAEKAKCQSEGRHFARKAEYNRLSECSAKCFPHREDLVLPTSFGNVVRAYEDYSRVMYGFESITGWSRLQVLFSKQAAEVLSRARARVDMWLNFCFLAVLFTLELGAVAWKKEISALVGFMLVGVLCGVFAYYRARSSAIRYGEQVKAAFDIYLPQLGEQLGFRLSLDVKKNRAFWEAYSLVMVFRDTLAIEEMFSCGLEMIHNPKSSNHTDASGDDGDD